MTTISAKVITDSISPLGKRILSFETESPRWIHSEGRTHRRHAIGEVEGDAETPTFCELCELSGQSEPSTPSLMADPNLSRNASSSRAIPVERQIQAILDNPAVPLFWGSNQSGMQAGAELTGRELRDAKVIWHQALNSAIIDARRLAALGAHKQIVNRILEPYSHIKVVVTATELSNFFALRRHKDAEPHIRLLADCMWDAMQASTPKLLQPGEWHLPYVKDDDRVRAWHDFGILTPEGACLTTTRQMQALKTLSAARTASISYKTVDGQLMTFERAESLCTKLMGTPLHASPFEHQATPDTQSYYERTRITGGKEELVESGLDWDHPKLHGNLVGWIQQRKTMPRESIQH